MKTFSRLCCLLVLLNILVALQAKNVKTKNYCEIGPCYSMNLPCNNKGKIKHCLAQTKLLKERDYRYLIQGILNNLRNTVAEGKTYRNLPAAARMGKMTSDKELAYFARLDVSRCDVRPRPCMSSTDFEPVGSLAGISDHIPRNSSLSMKEAIRDLVLGWFDDIHSITRSDTLHLRKVCKDGFLSAALLIMDYNTQFGCAIFRYTRSYSWFIILSCVFGTDNQDDQLLYKWGLSPAAKCHKRDQKYKNLCAMGETYDTRKP